MYSHAATLLEPESPEDWLEARRTLITASDAAAITGDSPFSFFDAIVQRKIDGSRIEQNQAMWFGHQREACNARILEQMTRLEVCMSGELWVSKEFPFLGATLDAYVSKVLPAEDWWETLCTAPRECQLRDLPYEDFTFGTPVELKNVASRNRSLWNKDVPPRIYWCQKQCQLLVTGHPVGILAAAVDSCEMYVHVIREDKAYQAKLVEAAKRAHEKVMEAQF